MLETATAAGGVVLAWTVATAEPLAYQARGAHADPLVNVSPQPEASEALGSAAGVPVHLRRRVVRYAGGEAAGTVVIDTPNTYLYYVMGEGTAVRYGIGVGREGFAWAGVKFIDHKTEWPDWTPPPEMIERQPYLPRFMAGGPSNPLGARAIYLGGTLYRIHGTNAPSTIGKRVSSGCIRMLNEDVIDLYARVQAGTRVVVLPVAPTDGSHAAAAGRFVPDRAPDPRVGAVQAFGIY